MAPYVLQAYQQAAVNVIYDKERLVVMVFDGLVDFLGQAKTSIIEGHHTRKGEAISTMLALLAELDCALDRDAGGEMAQNLAVLYHWLMTQITEANLHNDLKVLDQVENVLLELKTGFEGAARQLAPRSHGVAPAGVAAAAAMGDGVDRTNSVHTRVVSRAV